MLKKTLRIVVLAQHNPQKTTNRQKRLIHREGCRGELAFAETEQWGDVAMETANCPKNHAQTQRHWRQRSPTPGHVSQIQRSQFLQRWRIWSGVQVYPGMNSLSSWTTTVSILSRALNCPLTNYKFSTLYKSQRTKTRKSQKRFNFLGLAQPWMMFHSPFSRLCVTSIVSWLALVVRLEGKAFVFEQWNSIFHCIFTFQSDTRTTLIFCRTPRKNDVRTSRRRGLLLLLLLLLSLLLLLLLLFCGQPVGQWVFLSTVVSWQEETAQNFLSVEASRSLYTCFIEQLKTWDLPGNSLPWQQWRC